MCAGERAGDGWARVWLSSWGVARTLRTHDTRRRDDQGARHLEGVRRLPAEKGVDERARVAEADELVPDEVRAAEEHDEGDVARRLARLGGNEEQQRRGAAGARSGRRGACRGVASATTTCGRYGARRSGRDETRVGD